MKTPTALRLGMLAALAAFAVAPAEAKLAWLKKSKPLDAGVTGCISCHVNAKPKKNEPLNERGQWLVNEKEKRAVEEIDLAWLKDYPKNGQDLAKEKEANP